MDEVTNTHRVKTFNEFTMLLEVFIYIHFYHPYVISFLFTIEDILGILFAMYFISSNDE